MRAPELGSARLPLAIGAAALIVSVGSTASAFRSPTDSPANSVTAAPDFRAPAVTASAVGKTQGGSTGFIKEGGTYFVYANVTDSGKPASGTASVTANLTSLTAGASTVTLSPAPSALAARATTTAALSRLPTSPSPEAPSPTRS